MTLKEIREKAGELMEPIARYRKIVADEGRALTAEEDENFQSVCADYESLKKQAEVLERTENMTTYLEKPAKTVKRVETRAPGRPSEPEGANVNVLHNAHLRMWQGRSPDPAIVDYANSVGYDLRSDAFEVGLPKPRRDEYRALSALDGATGGFLVPESTLMQSFEAAMLAFGGMRNVAQVIQTTSGEVIRLPMGDDTSNKATRINENTQTSESSVAFTALELNAWKYSSGVFKIPVELTQDATIDVMALVGEWAGERHARKLNYDCTVGTGALEPKGVVTSAAVGRTSTGTVTDVTAVDIFHLFHSIDPSYRPNSRWMMHDSVVKGIRIIQEATTNAFMWQPGLALGKPDTLLGYPISVNQDMADTIEASAKIMLFGDFSKYKIREVRNVRIVRLDQRYADYDQIGVIAWMRYDGALLNAGTNPVKYLVQAAS